MSICLGRRTGRCSFSFRIDVHEGKRIVTNIAASDIEAAGRFYRDALGLELWMDHGWIMTYGSGETMDVQISIASQGESGTVVPDLSIEADDVDAATS